MLLCSRAILLRDAFCQLRHQICLVPGDQLCVGEVSTLVHALFDDKLHAPPGSAVHHLVLHVLFLAFTFLLLVFEDFSDFKQCKQMSVNFLEFLHLGHGWVNIASFTQTRENKRFLECLFFNVDGIVRPEPRQVHQNLGKNSDDDPDLHAVEHLPLRVFPLINLHCVGYVREDACQELLREHRRVRARESLVLEHDCMQQVAREEARHLHARVGRPEDISVMSPD